MKWKRLRETGNSPRNARGTYLRLNARLLQVGIHTGGGLSAFGNRPDHERLSTPHIARRKYSRNRRHIVFVGGNIAAMVELHSQLFDYPLAYRPKETHGDQHKVSIHGEFGPSHRFKLRGRANPYSVKLFDVAAVIAR